MIEKILSERDKIMMASMLGQKIDFSNLRKECKFFNEKMGKEIFLVSEPDNLFWKSVTDYLNKNM